MKLNLKNACILFSAGAAGALANSLCVWLFGTLGITAALGVKIAPVLNPGWLYPRLVWGGIWAALFFLPVLSGRLMLKGLVLSAGPTLVQLLIVFPFKAQKGLFGLDIGTLTPLFVILFNAAWGLVAAAFIARASKE
jgi:hypothetical protein